MDREVAQAQGRAPLWWALISGLIGAALFALGIAIFERSTELDASTGVMMLTLLLPLVLMVASMTAVVIGLARAPIHVVRLRTSPVHFVDRGEGCVRFDHGKVAFEWRDGAREVALPDVRAQADGECVRVTIANGDELCLMPLGKPETSAGRRQQSVLLAGMLGRS